MKKILTTLFILLATFNSAFAINESKKISLQEAIDIALETNPQIKISKLNVQTSTNEIKSATRLQNPEIYTFQNMGTTGKSEPQQIGVNYTVELFKRGKRKNLAESNALVAQDNQKFSEYDLILKVKETYIDLLLKKSILEISNQQKELAKQMLETAQKEDSISQTDTVQAKIAYNKAIMEYNKARNEVIFSQNRFNTVMNTSNVDFDTKEDSLSSDYASLLAINPKDNYITFDEIKQHTLSARYDLKSAKQNVISAQENLKVVKSNLIPDIELTGGYGYQTKGYSGEPNSEHGAFAGVSLVNIPLLYRYKPEIKNAQLEIEKAELKCKDVEIDALRNVADAWEKYIIAKDTLNFYNDELLLNSRELLYSSIQSYNKKEIDMTSFLVSKKTYFSLISDYQNALAEYYLSYANLLKEMNVSDINEEV